MDKVLRLQIVLVHNGYREQYRVSSSIVRQVLREILRDTRSLSLKETRMPMGPMDKIPLPADFEGLYGRVVVARCSSELEDLARLEGAITVRSVDAYSRRVVL